MKKLMEYLAVLAVGSASYSLIEIFWRGFTHWTMALTGGVCMMLIYAVHCGYSSTAMWKRCLAGCLIITTAELSVGFVVNILLGWSVWSYSGELFNFHGLICPLYTLLWFFLCIPADMLCGGIGRIFSGLWGLESEGG